MWFTTPFESGVEALCNKSKGSGDVARELLAFENPRGR